MESFATQSVAGTTGRAARASAYIELTKPRITTLVALTAAAGFCLGSANGIDLKGLIQLSVGIILLSSGIGALNQYLERDLDRLMRRTAARPLPAGKLSPGGALLFGMFLSCAATAYLAVLVNPLSAILGVLTLASYLFVYTPLKTRSPISTTLGAVPGAMPPFIGWVAARGEVGIEAWVLFAILFLWQFPHFLAIALMYREDYARAGIKMLPVVEPEGRSTGLQILIYTLALIPVSTLPFILNVAGRIYVAGALMLGAIFLFYAVRTATSRTARRARALLLASVLYLPLLFGLMVLNR